MNDEIRIDEFVLSFPSDAFGTDAPVDVRYTHAVITRAEMVLILGDRDGPQHRVQRCSTRNAPKSAYGQGTSPYLRADIQLSADGQP